MSGASRGGNAKRGRGGGTSRAAGRSEDDIRVSKKLSRLLRHNPPACVDKSGWVPIEVVKSTLGSVQDTAQILRVVHSDEKGRFQVDLDHHPPRMRATQGHTIQLEEPILKPITDPSEVAAAVHVTSKEIWKLIQQDGFLRKMARTHIHFATKLVLARANKWADCFLQLDVGQALADGVTLYLSTNGVLLCEGPLPVKYVKQIEAFPAGKQLTATNN